MERINDVGGKLPGFVSAVVTGYGDEKTWKTGAHVLNV